MKRCFWGNTQERASARRTIQELNRHINMFNVDHGRDADKGLIDEVDWSNAGKQLDWAVRDVHL
jgi:hypothetical protein